MKGNQAQTLNVTFTGKCRNEQEIFVNNIFVAFIVYSLDVSKTMALTQISENIGF